MFEIQTYVTETGHEPYVHWLNSLSDRQARARILVRIGRMSAGYWEDVKPLGEGVWEARIDQGPGYRLYYALAGRRLILLLMGGDKRRQQQDIAKAIDCWADWQRRSKRK